jgi:hypothetical protein
MASSVYNAYAQSAGEINNNLAGFREDVDNIKAVNRQIVGKNKQLLQDAYTKTDLDALRGLGEEVGIRTFKKYGGKALDYVDNRFAGGKISSDTEGFNNMVRGKFNQLRGKAEQGVDDLMGRGRSAIREGRGRLQDMQDNINQRSRAGAGDEDGDVEMNETGGGSGGAEGGEGFEADGSATSGAVEDPANVDEADMSFDDFMNQFEVPRTANGDIDFDRAGEQTQMGMEDARGQQLRSNAPERTPSSAPEETGNETKEDAGEETKEGDGAEDGAEEGEDALADAGEGAGETAVDEGVGAGLEGAGTALDATGIGAVIGVPLQVAGAVLEGGALYEAGKGIVDWVEQLFGKKPDAPSVKQVSIPKPPPTLAQRGMLITPTMDTTDTQPSFAGGW